MPAIGSGVVARLEEELRRSSVDADSVPAEWAPANEADIDVLRAELEAHDSAKLAAIHTELHAEHQAQVGGLLGMLRTQRKSMKLPGAAAPAARRIRGEGRGGVWNAADIAAARAARGAAGAPGAALPAITAPQPADSDTAAATAAVATSSAANADDDNDDAWRHDDSWRGPGTAAQAPGAEKRSQPPTAQKVATKSHRCISPAAVVPRAAAGTKPPATSPGARTPPSQFV